MGQDPIILEISSDDDEDVVNKPVSKSLNGDASIDWLADMLDLDDDQLYSDLPVADHLSEDCPDVKLTKLPSIEETGRSDGDSDDDCQILDGDPDKSVTSVKRETECSDELVVVGEKGQVACRDFPHSRHLCVTFPFKTTSHNKFCKMCHCYVCDVLAPCDNWSAHCHSTDKEERWIHERKYLRQLKRQSQNPPAAAVGPPYHPHIPQTQDLTYANAHISVQYNPRGVGPLLPFHHCSMSIDRQPTIRQCFSSYIPTKRPRTASHHVYHQRHPPMPPHPAIAAAENLVWNRVPIPQPYDPQPITKTRTHHGVPRPNLLAPPGREKRRQGE